MKNALLTNEQLAYAAGFFDGEGHIQIRRHSKRGSYMLAISAVQATENPLQLFVNGFGGTLKRRLIPYRNTFRVLWTWQCSSASAQDALEAMLPYLRVKRDEADLALEFRRTFRPQFGERSKNPPELEEKREAMMYGLQDMRKAKRESA